MASTPQRQGMQALVTRPREDAQTLAAELAARGIAVLIEPLIEIRFRQAELDLAGVQAMLCTSANGARALARATAERAIPLLAVGEATATRARIEGFAAVTSAGGDVTDLTRLAIDRLRPQNGLLLHVSGSSVAGDLTGELSTRGFAIERRVLYDAEPPSALSAAAISALNAAEIDFALFFSPRTAAIFSRLAQAADIAKSCEAVTALSISVAADKALDSLPWRERQVAPRPEQPALLDLLDCLLAKRRHD